LLVSDTPSIKSVDATNLCYISHTYATDQINVMSIQGFVISLGLQLKNHKVIVSQIASRLGGIDKAQQYLNKCLYYVNIGSNDYINNYFLPQFYPTSHTYSPEQYAEALIQELSLNLLVYDHLKSMCFTIAFTN